MRPHGSEADGRPLEVEEARALVLEAIAPLGPETVSLAESFGRVLCRPVTADDPAPPFDASEMDGYAVRADDVAAASEEHPVVLRVAFEVHAGAEPRAPLPGGECCWIATGAPLPSGADAVVPREWARAHPGERAEIRRPPGRGAFVRRAGDDWARGEEVLAAGAILTPGRVALAASCGRTALEVRRRPRVAILATGDELLEPGSALRPGTIRESNRLLLAGSVAAAGGDPRVLGIVPDDPEATARALEEAFLYDLALTAGGVSVGERDFVRDALERLGAPPRFWRVAVKPGKPLAFATRRRRDGGAAALFALPGNPASALVSFHLFVAPAIRRLVGRAEVAPVALGARVEDDVRGAPDRRTYLRAVLRSSPEGLVVRPTSRQASGSVRSLAEANALIALRPGESAAKGTGVRVEPLDWATWAGP